METSYSAEPHEEWVAIREDTQEWIKELSDMLSENDIPSGITLAPGCSAGSCGCRFRLMVARENIQAALECIDEYYMILHPEHREAEEWAGQDRCPACGHDVDKDTKNCPDCGLLLMIEG